MKIAIHNSFIGKQFAESELVRRICLAAQNLGWEAIEVDSPMDIDTFNPDFVLVTHFNTPKLSKFPTYGCMWSPPIFLDQHEVLMEDMKDYTKSKRDMMKYANVFSYDGYLSSSQKVDDWLNQDLSNTAKQYFIAPFFTSCNQTEYLAPNLQDPHLVYIGSNWDGSRFKQLFKGLDLQEFMEVYGSNWNYLKKAYKGSLPFDGVSVVNTLRHAGVGLCLHKPEHTVAETPSMRIFEIIASGALAICGEHKFIRDAFGDNVFYIDTSASISTQLKQISSHIDWIKHHRQEALEISRKAHELFVEKYSLEKLLLEVIPYHQHLIKEKGFINANIELPQKQIEFIVRIGDRGLKMIKRCLDSVVNQTYKNVAVILVKYKEIEGLSELLEEYNQLIKIKVINSKCTGFRSTQLKDGFNAITADYFGILDDDDVIYPNHAYLLISLLEKYKFADVAYSGSIKTSEEPDTLTVTNKELTYFEDFDLKRIAKFKNFITSNSFIARSISVTNVYKEDPQLTVSEDFYLILQMCQKSILIFSYEATCEFYWRVNTNDNATSNYDALTGVDLERVISGKLDPVSDRLHKIFWNEDFIDVINRDSFLTTDIETKRIKLSELKYTKSEQILGAGANSFSMYRILKNIYLRLSMGGNYNKNPNLLNKFLIYLRNLIYN